MSVYIQEVKSSSNILIHLFPTLWTWTITDEDDDEVKKFLTERFSPSYWDESSLWIWRKEKKEILVMGGCSETSANCVINDIITENRNQQVLNQNERKGRVKNNRNKCQIIMLYALNL